MAGHTEEEIAALRQRADKAEAKLAALQGDVSTPDAKEAADDSPSELADGGRRSYARIP